MIWLTLVFASLLSVAGQLCQKQATCFVAINKRRKHIVLWLGLALACLGLAMMLWLLGYLLSVFCWYKTLHKLALSKAYALLSMSYVLVWIASMVLPGWEGTFSLKALLGVACIMSGLMLIFLPTTKQRY
ncbi:4-amino-4-deoxy-L-arabinose-phosphoundecaprenol flippase subunit ArnE [Shigella flexneri]|nr:4-amino-4-deoxy-L-arabinose-phosphoundecaprenol flippase subunit ArnE [Escherichia coli]ELL9450493.1 4-amino-4-deoxy-L-arabinose-phosphoundecaprenol flippase subunit ArnE [Shigella flexneri]